jgi:hypothetical protein
MPKRLKYKYKGLMVTLSDLMKRSLLVIGLGVYFSQIGMEVNIKG